MISNSPKTGAPSTRTSLLVLLALLAIVFAMQLFNASYESEFGRDYDEAAHFVTGLMLRDFLVGLDWTSPLQFAENYYLHYPKVALGHWPPVFYALQASWYLVFPPARWSSLVLLAVLSAVLGWVLWRTGASRFDWRISFAFSALLLVLPLSQDLYSVCMAEIPLALLVLLATLAWGRYLDDPGWKWSLVFSALSVLAILTKANALALALLPLTSLLIVRRWSLLRQVTFWFPALSVLALCGPWYALTLDMLQNGPLARGPRFWYTVAAVPRFSGTLLDAAGPLLTVAGLLAMIVVVGTARDDSRQGSGLWVTLTGLVVSVMIFHWIVPASFDPRHLYSALPPVVLLALFGMDSIFRRAAGSPDRAPPRLALLTLVVVIGTLVLVFEVPHRTWNGFGAVAEHLVNAPDLESSVVLVVSDSLGEGALISEVAVQESRPGHVVLRSSKSLSRSSWDGSNYRLLFDTPAQLDSWLRQIPVGVIAVDRSLPRKRRPAETDLLLETLSLHADRWQRIGQFDMTRNGQSHPRAIDLYLQRNHQLLPRHPITLDLLEMLGRNITGQGVDSLD